MKPQFELYFLNFVLLLLLLYWFKPVYYGKIAFLSKRSNSTKQFIYYGVVLLTLSVFGFYDLDFYSYFNAFILYRNGGKSEAMEPIYQCLIEVIPNYFLWRLLIWGVSLILMCKTIKRLQLNAETTLIFVTLLYVFSFYKLRNTLGFSIFFWGIALFQTPRESIKTLEQFIGICLVGLSYFFHKSMVLTIVMLIPCVLSFSKLQVTCLLFAWPFFITVVTFLLNYITTINISEFSDDMNFISKAVSYASAQGDSDANLFGIIQSSLMHVSVLLPLLYITLELVYRRVPIPKRLIVFYKLWFISTYVAYLFAMQEASRWLLIRIHTMGIFPMCIILGWYFSTHKRNKPQKAIMLFALVSYLYGVFYGIYRAYETLVA